MIFGFVSVVLSNINRVIAMIKLMLHFCIFIHFQIYFVWCLLYFFSFRWENYTVRGQLLIIWKLEAFNSSQTDKFYVYSGILLFSVGGGRVEGKNVIHGLVCIASSPPLFFTPWLTPLTKSPFLWNNGDDTFNID